MSSKNYILNIAEILPKSRIYGPGQRFVIWVQGCNLHCEGCWNTEMWSFENKQLLSVTTLFDFIKQQDDVEGITILGGEPLHQSVALLSLVKLLKEEGYTIMLYTGFEKREIKNAISKELVSHSDIVVFGRYRENLRSIFLKWRGSSNQEIWINEQSTYKHFHTELSEKINEVEIHVNDNGEVTLAGYPENDLLADVLL